MSEDQTNNVIPFQPVASVRRMHKHFSFIHCRHLHLVAHDDLRMIECEDCGAYLDPYTYFIEFIEEKKRVRCRRRHETMPDEVKELLNGKSNTSRRRETLRRYLADIFEWMPNK